MVMQRAFEQELITQRKLDKDKRLSAEAATE
jgi:hypothetical protein